MQCDIDKTLKNQYESLSKKWDDKVENLWKRADELWENASKKGVKWADEKIKNALNIDADVASFVTGIRQQSRQIDDILHGYHQSKAAVYAQANRVKEYLEGLNKDDSVALFKALNGELDPTELNEMTKGLYDRFRKIIDDNAKALVNAGALKDENQIQNYIKHYYTKQINEGRAKALAYSKLHKRKDLTNEEKVALGLVQDADFAVANTLAEQRLQLMKAKTLEEFAKAFGKDEAYKGGIRVSDETVGGGIKKYGALGGKYVDEEVYKALQEAEIINKEMSKFSGAYFALVDHIKVNVTVKNPMTHLYNVGSNMLLSYLHGDVTAFVKTLKMIGSSEFKRLSNLADELGLDSHLNDLEGLKKLDGDGKDGFFVSFLKNMYMAEGSKLGGGMRKAYSWEDKIFKIARFRKNLEELAAKKGIEWNEFNKFSPDELKAAMADASYSYVDYSTSWNGTLKFLDKSGFLPFIQYTVKSTPMVVKTIMKNPGRFALLQMGLMGFDHSSFLGDNDKENLLKPKWAQSGALPNLLGVKSWTQIRDGWFFNSGRLMPGMRFDGFDSLEFSGGFIRGVTNVLAGKTAMGYNLYAEDDDLSERFTKGTLELMKSYFPPITMGRYAQNLGAVSINKIVPDAVDAPKDYNKNDLGYGAIALRAAGVREFDTKKELNNKANKIIKESKKLEKSSLSADKKAKKRKELERKLSLVRQEARKRGVRLKVEWL